MSSIQKRAWTLLTLASLAAVGCADKQPSAAPNSEIGLNTLPPTAVDQTAVGGEKAAKIDGAATSSRTISNAPSEGDSSKATTAKPSDPKPASGITLTDDEVSEIKKLPANDQAHALAQAVCPVSGEHLGSMGAPIKVTAEGKTFFLCCNGCKSELEKDPKAVLAKLSNTK